MSEKERQNALAEEQTRVFREGNPVSISIYSPSRQMPHYHRDAIEIIMCIEGSVEVYSMHEKHVLHAGDIKEADTFDIHTVTAVGNEQADSTYEGRGPSLAASFHFDLTHPLFAGKGYELLYYVCSSDGAHERQLPALNRLRQILLALMYEVLWKGERIAELSAMVLENLRGNFQYFNDINLDDTYSEDMQQRFEHIIAYMLEHYAEKITMGDICQIEHLNYNYMSQFFKTTSLKTFRNFLHEIRVYHSEHLLLCRPDLTVPEIAYACGFSDPKFYYREFKKKHGHTPHQHRIWYRNYNRQLGEDKEYSLTEMRVRLEHSIAGFLSGMVGHDMYVI